MSITVVRCPTGYECHDSGQRGKCQTNLYLNFAGMLVCAHGVGFHGTSMHIP